MYAIRSYYATYKFSPGKHTITVTSVNKCGRDSQTTDVIVKDPCYPPEVEFTLTELNQSNATHKLSGNAVNIENRSDITISVDGVADNSFQFESGLNNFNSTYNFSSGTHTITVSVTNDCGQDSGTKQVTVGAPCNPPVIELSVSESNLDNFTHQLNGTISNIENVSDITITADGKPDNNFRFVSNTNQISSVYIV